MEQRQDGTDAKVDTLAATVARVELNQTHQAELSKLRFDALDTSVGTVHGTLERFMGRVEGLITGEVRLPQSEKMLKDYENWHESVEDRLDKLDPSLANRVRILEDRAIKQQGVFATFGAGRALILAVAAAAGPIIAIIALVAK